MNVKITLAFALCLVVGHVLGQGNPQLQKYYNEAREAYKAGDHVKFYTAIIEANKLHPYHQGILYNCGLAAALNNKSEEAISFLTRAIQIKADYDLNNPDLKSLEGNKEFQDLKLFQKEAMIPVHFSDTAFIVKDRSLHIECIAAGKNKNEFYLGSIHKRKIIRVNGNGNITEFVPSKSDGLTSVFGIKIDAKKNLLWACASPIEESEGYDSTLTSAVFKYDLKSGKLLQKYQPENPKGHIFGDLTLAPDGGVYVSDSRDNHIYKVNESSRKLDDFFTSDEFWNLQGITFSTDGQLLFIADYVKGIYRLEMKDKALVRLNQLLDISTKGIDGLTYTDNGLIAIQNAVLPMRVTHYRMNKEQDGITGYSIIDRAHPAFNEPTIGCIREGYFYYVANSLWSGYTEDHKLKSPDKLQDVVILRAPFIN
jgi:sugar lactone lactonase YvrE